ncbi:hypothetical protein SynBIOSE41_03789 [Synechococcus sp. BIOS-E4-1]|nr:hypothetical protein SynBIOSE41_03789 [Synechococcus sp. BIOS-E4-1]
MGSPASAWADSNLEDKLSHSPKAHQNLLGTAPELCSVVHQRGCDLEGVDGAAPHTTLN